MVRMAMVSPCTPHKRFWDFNCSFRLWAWQYRRDLLDFCRLGTSLVGSEETSRTDDCDVSRVGA